MMFIEHSGFGIDWYKQYLRVLTRNTLLGRDGAYHGEAVLAFCYIIWVARYDLVPITRARPWSSLLSCKCIEYM
jgi:hypothetical protein